MSSAGIRAPRLSACERLAHAADIAILTLRCRFYYMRLRSENEMGPLSGANASERAISIARLSYYAPERGAAKEDGASHLIAAGKSSPWKFLIWWRDALNVASTVWSDEGAATLKEMGWARTSTNPSSISATRS